jgi:hypothetical protein
MDDPIKIIWKFKNNNRRIQYHTYIFVGELVPELDKVFNKIKSLNLYDTFIQLSKAEYGKLESKYGERWFDKFFNMYHINFTIDQIKNSQPMKKELITKYGEKWYNTHIDKYQLSDKKLIYSYAALIKDERERKVTKKGRSIALIKDDEADIDYKTNKTIDIKKMLQKKVRRVVPDDMVSDSPSDVLSDSSLEISDSDVVDDLELDDMSDALEGGARKTKGKRKNKSKSKAVKDVNHYDVYPYMEEHDYDDIINQYEHVDKSLKLDGETDEVDSQVGGDDDSAEMDEYFESGLDSDDMLEDDSELEDIEKIYQGLGEDVDESATKTTSLIQQALDDDKLFEKKQDQMIEFNQDKDNNVYDESLKDVFVKTFVKSQYISKDDTIKATKEKIACALKNNKKFDKSGLLVPSRQYIWCEYVHENQVNKVMLGQKWLRRNELLDIDIEPNNNMRYYEELPGKLKLLRDNIRRYGNKIRIENDENFILYDYEDYMANNEIYMIDVYNEFGKDYKPDIETQRNLQDVYLKLYFPKTKSDDMKSILEYLQGNPRSEHNKVTKQFETINNDQIMENEIVNVVEKVRMKDNYRYIFKDNYITQSVIHLNLRLLDNTKIDLFRIFNEFTVDNDYPFIQLQTAEDGVIKFYEKDIYTLTKNKDSVEVLYKWFENTPYGINFKVRIKNNESYKYMGVVLSENGRIEFKTQWKEEDMATIDNIKNRHEYVKNLIKRINNDKNKVKIDIPHDEEFKFAFINTIQKFELPNEFHINHNHLSNFARFFYPYVALVIDPRKRQAKVQKENDTSKFGTYLRFKKVSKYENQARLEQRIIYFMRNYEYTDQALANVISKQFNITEERALEEIEKVKTRFPNLKKSRKILKKLENIPKYKPPGIGIDVQGKQRDKYKIRISGARNKEQLDRIIDFMNILIYLYTETYLFKRPERQILKTKLKKLTNIAKRRSKVDELVNYSKEIKSVKQMTQLDKRRLGFKPEKGQNQWTRACQNSGTDKKRRPQQYNSNTLDQLVKKGYVYNKKTDSYEKKISVKGKKGKNEIVLRTIKLPEHDEEGNPTGSHIHYACDPDDNGEHMYIGFLTRSSNPYGHCMPCCFIINPATSKNKSKRDFFYRCLGQGGKENKKEEDNNKIVGDLLYILQDTNKIQEGRLGFLPKYLDFYFNRMLKKTKKIKHHYLSKTETGYYFKYGSRQDDYQFLNAITSTLDTTITEIKNNVVKALENDKNEHIFISLNNGDIKTQFGTREKFIDYVKNSNYLEYGLMGNLISIPGVLSSGGLNIVIFRKQNVIIAKKLEKEKIREDFYLQCQDLEDHENLSSSDRKTIFLMAENKNYYPIVMVKKPSEDSKNVTLDKYFTYKDEKENIVSHVRDFYIRNCHGTFIDKVLRKNVSVPAKYARSILKNLDKKFNPRYQVIDVRNKCKYIVTYEGYLVPVKRSGSLYDVQILKNYDKYVMDMESTVKYLTDLYEKSDKKLPVKPVGVYYDSDKQGVLAINAIMTKSRDVVPIVKIKVAKSKIESRKLLHEREPLTDKIDEEISKGKDNYIIDRRIVNVKNKEFVKESYELFRLEFSNYINNPDNSLTRNRIEKVMTNKKLDLKEKVDKIRLIIYKIIDSKMARDYQAVVDVQEGGKTEKFIHITSKLDDLTDYQVNNDREVCEYHKDKDKCNENPHCHWTHSGCYFSITDRMVVEFVNRISEELARNQLKAFELLRIGNHFVSDIVDYSKFTEKEGQKILRSSSSNIKKALSDLFGKDNIPKIGKRKTGKQADINYQSLNLEHPALEFSDMYIQKIIPNNLTIFRAYVNGFYWHKHKFSDHESRNLGYYDPVQTDLANYFRSLIVDWLKDSKNKKEVEDKLVPHMDVKKSSKTPIVEFMVRLTKEVHITTGCYVELYVFSKINKDIPIVVVDEENKIIYIFHNGCIYSKYDKSTAKVNTDKYKQMKSDAINIRFENPAQYKSPDSIEVLCYK